MSYRLFFYFFIFCFLHLSLCEGEPAAAAPEGGAYRGCAGLSLRGPGGRPHQLRGHRVHLTRSRRGGSVPPLKAQGGRRNSIKPVLGIRND